MGKKEHELGVKRKRGKKFKWQPEASLEVKRLVKTKSVFRDKRLGERNPSLNPEQKYLLRFQRERDLISRRKQRFELDDNLELTHKGVRLQDLQDDYVEDYDLDLSDDEPRKQAKMDDDLVLDQHFGDSTHKSRKNAYEDLIQQSKQNKMMRQQEKEENIEITRKLDGEFTDIAARLRFKNKEKDRDVDDYDNLLLEMREEYKVQAELGKVDVKTLEIVEKWKENGENWKVPESYKEFVVVVREKPDESVKNMQTWMKLEVKKEKTLGCERLLSHLLKFFLEELDDSSPNALDIHKTLCHIIYDLSKEQPDLSKRLFLSSALTLGKRISLSLVFFYHLVPLLFSITFADPLTSSLSTLANCILLESTLSSFKTCRNLLFFSKVYRECWLQEKYCPELTRFLLRVLEEYKRSEPANSVSPQQFFESESPSDLHSYASELLSEQKKLFEDSLAYSILVGSEGAGEGQSGKALKLYEKPIEEIKTYEPLIFDKIRSLKKSKDINKEASEIDKLREQAKRAKKLAKKALEKETEVEQYEKDQDFRAGQSLKEHKQNLVRNMLDELQVEYKKFDTTLEKKKDKKKRKKRMGGGKMEQNK